MAFETIRVEHGAVTTITLNRPQTRNAMSRQMVEELMQALEAANSDEAVRVIVLRGTGGHFCAGADIADMARARSEGDGTPQALARINRGFGHLISAFDASPKTVVAVLEGAVLGGGLGLACVADITISRADARLGLPEATLGLVPAQIIPFVVGRVGLSQARYLALTARRIDGTEAFRIGLVHELADGSEALEVRLDDLLDKTLHCAPMAARTTKALLLGTREMPTESLLDHGAKQFAELAAGEEAMEGATAFMQKRKPTWAAERAARKEQEEG